LEDIREEKAAKSAWDVVCGQGTGNDPVKEKRIENE